MRRPSWKISVLSQALDPGSRPPTSPWCAVVTAQPISVSVEVDRLDDEDVLQVHAPVEGVVHDEDVTGADAVAVVPEQRVHRGRDRAEVEGDADGLGDRLAPRVAERGREVHAVADDGRVRGADDRRRHLVRDRLQRVRDDLQRHRIRRSAAGELRLSHRAPPARARALPCSSGGARSSPSGTTTVVSYSSTSSGPASAPDADRRTRAHGHVGRLPPTHMRRVASRSGDERVGTSNDGARPRSRRAPRAAPPAPRPASPAGRARRRAPRARPRSAPAGRGGAHGRRRPAAARPRSPSSGRRSGGRRCAASSGCRRGRRTRCTSIVLHLVEQGGDRGRIDLVDVEVARAHLVELGPREEEPDGAEQPGHRRDEHGRRRRGRRRARRREQAPSRRRR